MFPMGAALLLLTWYFLYRLGGKRNRGSLDHIPSVGGQGILASYVTAFKFMSDANSVLQQGYEKYRDGAFKIPQMDRWIIIVSGSDMLDALRGAPEHILSMEAAMTDLLSADYTLGTETLRDTYHLGVIKNAMNKQLGYIVPAIADETKKAFGDIIGKRMEKVARAEWTSIRVNEVITDIVCRAVNRAFVGEILCNYPSRFICIPLNYTQAETKTTVRSTSYSPSMSYLVRMAGAAFTRISGLRTRMASHIEPLIKARSKDPDRKVGFTENITFPVLRPCSIPKNDMLTWLMEAAPAHEKDSADALALRILNVNFMALHSTAMTFTHALLHLASKPEYLQPLRQELEEQFGNSLGITTFELETFDKCWKLDSFLKESQRLNGLGAFSMPRKALVPFQFPDGTIIPAGAIVATVPPAIHVDGRYYKNAQTFDGFRFASERGTANGGQSDAHLRLTGLGNTYLSFGGGRHACPGRFLASIELKCMLSHVILEYDVKMAEEGVRPSDDWFGPMCIPSAKAEVLFRRRRGNL
ncbi:cytochrome P450 [Mycena capillaripes]|nr:cytochrome P450 [Mycena capillaripes]